MSRKGFVPKDGEYFYCPRGRMWYVYLNHVHPNGTESGEKVCEFQTKEEAAAEVARRNGWT